MMAQLIEKYFEYDVGLSFAGEQRSYVDQVAKELVSRGVRVFFDDYEQGVLWGKDLYAYLSDVYQHRCRFCVIFVSKEYSAKVWPNRERQSAQARAIEEKQEYILPARFDDTPIPGLLDTVGYIDLTQTTPLQLAGMLVEKLGKRTNENYLPPTLDRMYEYLGVDIENDADVLDQAYLDAWSFFQVLRRLTKDERNAVINLIRFGCPTNLPEDIHINSDLLSRHTGMSVASLDRLLSGIRSLGFRCSIRKDTEHIPSMPGETLGEDHFFHLTWINLNGKPGFRELLVAKAMIDAATDNCCEKCGTESLNRLDFSQLASATASKEGED